MFLFLSGISAGDIDTDKINIFLYTRRNPENFQIVELTEESLASSNFNPEHPIIILAHGWNSNGRENDFKGFGARFADDYLSVGEYNVFSCDWGKLEDIYYPHAAAVTEPVGQYLAGLIALLSDYGVMANIHLVGHSLGAHVMGSAAKEVQRLGLGRLRRPTGLDPAYPFFESIRAVNPEAEGGNRFLGRLCGSWEDFQAGLCCDNPTAVMGEWLEPSSPEGTYFYYVNEESPFALDEQGSC